jgi:hypothetical protein
MLCGTRARRTQPNRQHQQEMKILFTGTYLFTAAMWSAIAVNNAGDPLTYLVSVAAAVAVSFMAADQIHKTNNQK